MIAALRPRKTVIALAVAACFGYARADTFIQTNSDPDGYVVPGGDQRFDLTEGLMTVSASTRGANVRWTSRTNPAIDWWDFEFAPAPGAPLAAGDYYAFGSYSGFASLLVQRRIPNFGTGYVPYGPFKIYEMDVADDGSVRRFAADFEGRVLFRAGTVHAGIRFNSSIPYPGQPLAYPPAQTYIKTSYPTRLDRRLDAADGVMVVVATTRGLVVRWTSRADPADQWDFDFGGRDGSMPSLSCYYASADARYYYSGVMALQGDGHAYSPYGNFSIYELNTSSDGAISSLAADFQSIDSLSGVIRFNSSFPSPGPRCTPTPIANPLPNPLPTPTPTPTPAPDPTPIPTLITTARGPSPSGGTITLSMSGGNSTCTLAQSTFLNPAVTEFFDYPRNVSYPHGMVSFRADNCGAGASVTFSIQFPQQLPPTAQWWKYGPTPDNRSNHWYVIPSTVNGDTITFTLTDGGFGDDDMMMNGSVGSLGLLAIPGGTYQDLWWGGALEDGWGMSIAQHADKLFANLYVYDAQGNPVWYVMPSGAWDSTRTTFTGAVYLPKGSPFYAYDATTFDIGAAVGAMKLTFVDVNNAVFEYTINGLTARRNIARVLFGLPGSNTDHPHGDLWWAGSAQNGWGIGVMQQYSTLFTLWFTYDANGDPTWFVMSRGAWEVKDQYRADVYKTSGSPWLGSTYDFSRLRLTKVGTADIIFSGADNAMFNYTVEGKSGSIPLVRIPF